MDRRCFLKGFAKAAVAGAAGGVLLPGGARAQDQTLELLIQQNQRGEFGETFDSASRTIHLPQASLPTLSPTTPQSTEQAITQYEAIVARGGWPAIPRVEQLRLGMRHPGVTPLRERLIAAGDLEASAGVTDVYDSFVQAAVRRFQVRHGLTVDGIVREQTLKALNIPADVRLTQLKTNLVRLRGFSGSLGNRFVMVNLPAALIEAVENGLVVSRHVAVVGKPDRPSPEIQSKIVEINFNPYWTVPVSIVRRDLIPKMQAEPDYLTKNRIRIFDPHKNELQPQQINWYSEEAVNYQFKQDPGDFNSLGSIRMNFPNPHQVYMHDTPLKNLFGEDFRFHSSGCVRVQNVRELVYWLLSTTTGWSRAEIDQVIRNGERKDARLVPPVPLYWVYITAWAAADGIAQFREDIYNRDGLAGEAHRG
ncbi:MAG: L,D-transpeptidase family protein [Acidisphaera sp.]|nr:L,D-transpeptidase family protein [Acidisphaera sp.]